MPGPESHQFDDEPEFTITPIETEEELMELLERREAERDDNGHAQETSYCRGHTSNLRPFWPDWSWHRHQPDIYPDTTSSEETDL